MTDSNIQHQASRDHQHLWHPYTDIASYERAPYISIDRAEGIHLIDHTGRRIYDGISSWWCVALGHGHPHIIQAIQKQAATLQHSILGTLSHPPAVDLAARLAALCPGDLNHVYFASDGSSVVEAALKMAAQYWGLRGKPEKRNFMTLEGAYHGDTLGAISVGLTDWFEAAYGPLVQPALRLPTPHLLTRDPAAAEAHVNTALQALESALETHVHHTAALIIEPLVQAASGIRIYPASYLAGARRLCDAAEVLLIADEIATGFGRTGQRFACDWAGITPDILCLGKALTGGYLPMSALVARAPIYDAFRAPQGDRRVFWDGHTFTGNPICAAAALAALDLLETIATPTYLRDSIAALEAGFAQIAQLPQVATHQSLGMLAMCALHDTPGAIEHARRAATRALDLGLFTRPLGQVLYLWPPLIATPEDCKNMTEILRQAITETK